jgi:hypothetical protein
MDVGDDERDWLDAWSDELADAGFEHVADCEGREGASRVDRVRGWLSSDRLTWAHATFVRHGESSGLSLFLTSIRADGVPIVTSLARDRLDEPIDALCARHRQACTEASPNAPQDPAGFVPFLERQSAQTRRAIAARRPSIRLRLLFAAQLLSPFGRLGTLRPRRLLDATIALVTGMAGAAALLSWTPASLPWTVSLSIAQVLLVIVVLRSENPILWIHSLVASELVLLAGSRWHWAPVTLATVVGVVATTVRLARAGRESGEARAAAFERPSPPTPMRVPEPTAAPEPAAATLPIAPVLPPPPRPDNPGWNIRHRVRPFHVVVTTLLTLAGLLMIGGWTFSMMDRVSFLRRAIPVEAVVTYSGPDEIRFESSGLTGRAPAAIVDVRRHPVGSGIAVHRLGSELRYARPWQRNDWKLAGIGFAFFLIPAASLGFVARQAAALRALWRSGIEARAEWVGNTRENGLPTVRYRREGRDEIDEVTLRMGVEPSPLTAPENASRIVVLVDPHNPNVSAPVLGLDR